MQAFRCVKPRLSGKPQAAATPAAKPAPAADSSRRKQPKHKLTAAAAPGPQQQQPAGGLPEKLGDRPLRLIIVGHNPSDVAWAQGCASWGISVRLRCRCSPVRSFWALPSKICCAHPRLAAAPGAATCPPPLPIRLPVLLTPPPRPTACRHYYANPTNWMWRILKEVGIAPEAIRWACAAPRCASTPVGPQLARLRLHPWEKIRWWRMQGRRG